MRAAAKIAAALLAASCGSNGGGPGEFPADGAAPATVGQPAVCARYVSCVTAVMPAATAATLQGYGPDGSCWQGSAATASECARACENAIGQLRRLAPAGSECAKCRSDADCGGSTPACDLASGVCVTCLSDAHCPSSVCDAASRTCVECNRDQDCRDPTAPICDAHRCVGCTSGSQCSSGICHDQACCTPTRSCGWWTCGDGNDGCGGTFSCGTCAVGTCRDHTCSTVGTACTVGVTACATGEKCLFDDWHDDYRCTKIVEGWPCTSSDSGACNARLPDGSLVAAYHCGYSGKCVQLCLATAECSSGKTCKPDGSSSISTQSPGRCE